VRSVALVAALAALVLSGCATWQTGELKVPKLPGLRFVQAGEWRIRVDEVGAGKPLVLIHGYSSTLEEWRPALPYLCKERRCILMDLPGFGLSDKREGSYTPADMATHVVSVMDALKVDSADVIAHSWGCSVALAMALAYPHKVEKMVLTGPWVYEDQLPTFMLWARVPLLGEALFTALFDQQPEMRYQEVFFEPEKHVKAEDVALMKVFLNSPGAIRGALQAARDQNFSVLEPEYPKVQNETLVLSCEQDRVALPFYGKRLAADLPNSRLEFLHKCGHVPQVELPEKYSSVVSEFLNGSSGGGDR